jgi:predicted amidophosphoribosyltransferase
MEKVHAKSKSVEDSTLCVRAISVKCYRDLLVTDDESKVTCKQCLSRLRQRATDVCQACGSKFVINALYCHRCGTRR